MALRFEFDSRTGIELSCSPRLLPMPVELNGDACYPAKQGLFGIHVKGYTEPHGKDRKTAEILCFWETGVMSRPLRHHSARAAADDELSTAARGQSVIAEPRTVTS